MLVVIAVPGVFFALRLRHHKPAFVNYQVWFEFDGPWAIVPDPDNPGFILALAPKTEEHEPLTVSPSEGGPMTPLDAGIYEVVLDNAAPTADPLIDAGFFRVKVDPTNVRVALFQSDSRYAVRLPAPVAYGAGKRFTARIGSREEAFPLIAMLQYDVPRNLFAVGGSPDSGATFNPVLLQAAAHRIRFQILPLHKLEAMGDVCELHPRQAFHDLGKLLGMELTVKFPGLPAECANVQFK